MTVDLAGLSRADFEAHVGSEFVASRPDGGSLVLTLGEVRPLGQAAPGRRDGFALELRGPTRPVLDQGTHDLTHTALGRLTIFLVPVGRDERGIAYEAVFN